MIEKEEERENWERARERVREREGKVKYLRRWSKKRTGWVFHHFYQKTSTHHNSITGQKYESFYIYI